MQVACSAIRSEVRKITSAEMATGDRANFGQRCVDVAVIAGEIATAVDFQHELIERD